MFTFYFKIAISEARFHIINHLCSCLEVGLLIPVNFLRHREQEFISKRIKNIQKLKKNQNFERIRMYSLAIHMSYHVIGVLITSMEHDSTK